MAEAEVAAAQALTLWLAFIPKRWRVCISSKGLASAPWLSIAV